MCCLCAVYHCSWLITLFARVKLASTINKDMIKTGINHVKTPVLTPYTANPPNINPNGTLATSPINILAAGKFNGKKPAHDAATTTAISAIPDSPPKANKTPKDAAQKTP